MRRVAILVGVAALAAACTGPDPNLTESGQGRPTVAVEFPAAVAAGSVHDMKVTVDNPGPGDVSVLNVSFTLVGVAGERELPDPLVRPGTQGGSASVVGVDPEPESVSDDGTIYLFGDLDPGTSPAPFLAEGDSITLTFRVVVPDRLGLLANSVTAYDGRDPTRARGVLVTTEVEASGQ